MEYAIYTVDSNAHRVIGWGADGVVESIGEEPSRGQAEILIEIMQDIECLQTS